MPTRVHVGRLDAITGGVNQYGLYVSGPDGTAIIDGTSNVFKIVATGTIENASFSNPANPGSTASVTVATGLPYVPANLLYVISNGSTESHLMPYAIYGNTGLALDWWHGYAALVSPNLTSLNISVSSSRGSGTTPAYTMRWYLLKEVAY